MNSITSIQNKTKNHLKVEVHSSKIIIHVSFTSNQWTPKRPWQILWKSRSRQKDVTGLNWLMGSPLENWISILFLISQLQWCIIIIIISAWSTIPPISTKLISHHTSNHWTQGKLWNWKSRSWLGTGTKLCQG